MNFSDYVDSVMGDFIPDQTNPMLWVGNIATIKIEAGRESPEDQLFSLCLVLRATTHLFILSNMNVTNLDFSMLSATFPWDGPERETPKLSEVSKIADALKEQVMNHMFERRTLYGIYKELAKYCSLAQLADADVHQHRLLNCQSEESAQLRQASTPNG